MKKFNLAILFCLFLISNCFAQSDIHLENYYKLQESAVQLSIYCSDKKVYSCSGIIVKEDEYSTGILTAKHCIVPNVKKIVINEKYFSNKFKRAKDIDVAYIEIKHSLLRFNPVKISISDAKIYDYVYFLGYPQGQEYFQIGMAIYNGIKNQYIVMDSIGGCSGSGVANQKGELVGILWGNKEDNWLNQKRIVTIITPIESIKPFLIKLKIWNQLRFE